MKSTFARKLRYPLSVLALVGTISAAPAIAAEISVEINQSKLQKIPRAAATLIVGNPSIADVSVSATDTLIVLGRSFGHTNLIALDAAGQQISSFDIHVVETRSRALTINMGSGQYSYDCTPRCVRVINPTDAQVPTDALLATTQSATKYGDDVASSSGE